MKNKTIFYLLIIFIFLCFLFLCYHNLTVKKFELMIIGKKEAIGATVYINERRSGKMRLFVEKTSLFRKWLPHGTHVIEIKKEGFKTYQETITIRETASEHYLYVELVKDKED